MKKIGVLAAVLAMAFLCVGVAQAEMYVEGYIGAAGAFSNLGQTVTIHDNQSFTPHVVGRAKVSGVPDASVIGGLKVGTWFVKEGTLGWSGYPDWAKYFGFYTDFSYHNVVLREQRLGGTIYVATAGGASFANNVGGQYSAEGSVADWAFMFAGRYGFFQDSEVPFGRLQPYIAVGPAILFSSLQPKVNLHGIGGVNGATLGMSPGNAGSTTLGLQAEGGVRFYALKNVSFDISLKYEYAQPEFKYTGIDTVTTAGGAIVSQNPSHFTQNPAFNLFSAQVGVAYHF